MRCAVLARWLTAMLAGWISCGAAAAISPAPGKEYRITGVAVSSRDGSPVPFCRLSATSTSDGASAPPLRAAQGGRRGGPGGGPGPGNFPQFDGGRPGQRGGSPGRGNSAASSPASQDGEVTSDESGRFTLVLPHAGLWRLVGAARGYHPQSYEEHESYFTGIVLNTTVPTAAVTFRMAPDAGITGLVLDEAGEPVRQAQVSVIRLPLELPGVAGGNGPAALNVVDNATTDDRGRYESGGLAPGNYRVRVQAQPWYSSISHGGIRMAQNSAARGVAATQTSDPSLDVVYATTWYPAAESEDAAETIPVTAGEERQVDFHLTALPAVHVQVPHVDSPPAANGRPRPQRPATITRVSGDAGFNMVNFSANNGSNWDFGGLTPGTYEIHLPGPDGQSDGEVRQFEVRPGAAGVMTLDDSKPLTRVTIAIEGVPEDEVSVVEFVDPDTGRRIVSTTPPRGRRGRRGDDDEDSGDEDDLVRTAMLAPGCYEVTLHGRSGDYLSSISASGAQVLGSSVTISAGSPTLSLHVANARAEVSGVVRSGDEPVQGAMVLLVPVTLGQPGDFSTVLRAQSNTDGSFSIRSAVPGKYILLAIDHGWGVNWRRADALTQYLTRGLALELRPASKLTEVIPAQAP